ncbi:T6SS immunity protein Tli4 family protein [Massilia niastensis]|uniref:T6SS immunity protein Tli4 family protein n=1 Tax=Massilia niastensis TaxID=544911 RepID=UPI0003750BE7|nr:T6SS immunity protein Tli4 family protein [Massilia niastensis]
MTRCRRNGLAITLAAIVFACLAGTWALGAVRDQQEVARMTQKMKTVCIGRLLIDMPEDARIELTRPSVDGFDIGTFEESSEAFQARLADREAQIRAMPDRSGGTRNMELARDVKTDSGLIGKIFVHGRTVTEGTRARGLELERYRYEGIDVEALVHADGVSIDLAANNYFPDLIENLPKLVSQLVANPGNRVPAESGYCVDRAYIRDPLRADQGEQIMMFARLPSNPDVEFMLILAAGNAPGEQGLLERTRDLPSWLSVIDRWRVSTLRATRRTIGSMDGEEFVERVVEKNDAVVYSFMWEAPGTEDDVFDPHISFSMSTGKGNHVAVPSSLSQGAALGLWDRILSSIRIRPTALPGSSPAEPPTLPIGTYASAGDTCPQSGWWLCSDGGAGAGVCGGQRQFLKKGQRIPQALLLPPPTLWQRLRGLQPSFESSIPTVWTLADKRSSVRLPPPRGLAPAAPGPEAGAIPASALPMASAEAPIGSVARTGAACPASGWWRCENSHALDGTRWFAAGSLLPAATFRAQFHGRAAGHPELIHRRSAWQLVRHADAGGADQVLAVRPVDPGHPVSGRSDANPAGAVPVDAADPGNKGGPDSGRRDGGNGPLSS